MAILAVWEVCTEVDRIGERFLSIPLSLSGHNTISLRFIRQIVLSIPYTSNSKHSIARV